MKHKADNIHGLFIHNERGIDEPNLNHSNENIDKTRTPLNYDLKAREVRGYDYYKERIEDIEAETRERTGRGLRKDAVRLCEWVITKPQGLERQEEFFKAAYDFFSERYGEDNIISASVHLDEKTPHMHVLFTPIINREGNRVLCAKDLISRNELKRIHTDAQNYITERMGCKVELLNGATANGSRTLEELKRDSLVAENERLAAENKALRENLLDVPKYEKEEYPPRGDSERRYKKACIEVDKRNEKKRSEWDAKYMTADNLSKAERSIVATEERVNDNLSESKRQVQTALDLKNQQVREIERARREIQERAKTMQKATVKIDGLYIKRIDSIIAVLLRDRAIRERIRQFSVRMHRDRVRDRALSERGKEMIKGVKHRDNNDYER